jgi:hypothetical protein
MIEKQVDVVILVSDVEAILPANEGESLPEFEQELLQMADERGFEFPFVKWFR